jgi:hypothetical protein
LFEAANCCAIVDGQHIVDDSIVLREDNETSINRVTACVRANLLDLIDQLEVLKGQLTPEASPV